MNSAFVLAYCDVIRFTVEFERFYNLKLNGAGSVDFFLEVKSCTTQVLLASCTDLKRLKRLQTWHRRDQYLLLHILIESGLTQSIFFLLALRSRSIGYGVIISERLKPLGREKRMCGHRTGKWWKTNNGHFMLELLHLETSSDNWNRHCMNVNQSPITNLWFQFTQFFHRVS